MHQARAQVLSYELFGAKFLLHLGIQPGPFTLRAEPLYKLIKFGSEVSDLGSNETLSVFKGPKTFT